jgi:hypothetical protein
MAVVALSDFSWERMNAAVEAVQERARRAAAALQEASADLGLIPGG